MNSKEQRFREIVNAHQEKVYRLCRGFYPDSQDVDDLYQEIWIKIWLKLEQFRGEASISTWIYRIATNTAISHQAQVRKRQQRFVPSEAIQYSRSDTSTLVEKQEEERQLNQLYQAIHQLPEIDRIIMTMVLEGHSYQTIAKVTGLSQNYVGVRINRIKTRVKKMLTQTIN